jgi:hypothetical protein
MSRSGKSNHSGEYKTWHFTSVLTPTPEITWIFSWYAHESQHTDTTTGTTIEVRNWMGKMVLNGEKQGYVSFIALS